MDFEKEAREILAPLFNQPHPFQEEWSPLRSMSLDDLHEKIAQALLRAHRQGQEEMRERADLMCKVDANSWEQNGEHDKASACRLSGKNIRLMPLSIEEDKSVAEKAG